jgi:hypothetical protein
VTKSNYGPTGLAINMRWADGVFALAAPGDIPTDFKPQSQRNARRAEADTKRLSEALPPGEFSREEVKEQAVRLGLLDGVKPDGHRSKVTRLMTRVRDFRGRNTC